MKMKKILIAAALFIADANVAAVAADNVTEINQDEFVSKIYDYRTDSVAKSMALPAVGSVL